MKRMDARATFFRFTSPLSDIHPDPRRPHRSAPAKALSRVTATEMSIPRSTAKSTTTMT